MARNSSVELYRIIAIVAVIVFHFNGWRVGGMPKHFDVDHISSFRMSQAFYMIRFGRYLPIRFIIV